MKIKLIPYKDLVLNDVIMWYGAWERIVDLKRYTSHDGKKVVNFKLEPYNEESIQILGKFYAYGWYGGCDDLLVGKGLL